MAAKTRYIVGSFLPQKTLIITLLYVFTKLFCMLILNGIVSIENTVDTALYNSR